MTWEHACFSRVQDNCIFSSGYKWWARLMRRLSFVVSGLTPGPWSVIWPEEAIFYQLQGDQRPCIGLRIAITSEDDEVEGRGRVTKDKVALNRQLQTGGMTPSPSSTQRDARSALHHHDLNIHSPRCDDILHEVLEEGRRAKRWARTRD